MCLTIIYYLLVKLIKVFFCFSPLSFYILLVTVNKDFQSIISLHDGPSDQ